MGEEVSKAGAVENAFTVDLEDWYQGLEIDMAEWNDFEDRLWIGVRKLLNLLDEFGVCATFFALGYAAERAPELVREIHARGHEIGTHGYGHQFVYKMGKEAFRRDLYRSLEVLDRILQVPIKGYRAPFFSITRAADWAFDVMREAGIVYDSSVFPVYNYRYGMAGAPRWIYQARNGLTEFPLSTYRIWSHNFPLGGGAYFRIFPYKFTRYAMRQINAGKRAVVFYIHPWELDPEHPRLELPRRLSLTHYWNLDGTEKRIRKMMSEFSFSSMSKVLEMHSHVLENPR